MSEPVKYSVTCEWCYSAGDLWGYVDWWLWVYHLTKQCSDCVCEWERCDEGSWECQDEASIWGLSLRNVIQIVTKSKMVVTDMPQ